MTIERDSQRVNTFDLVSELTIYNATEIYHQLVSKIQLNQSIEVNLSQVQEIDSAGVQTLLIAKAQAEQQGKAFALRDHSPAALEALELLGVVAHFGDPILLSASEGAK